MQCVLLSISDEGAIAKMAPEQQQATFVAFREYVDALKEAGVWIGNHRLQPMANAKTVRVTDGGTDVRDGLHVATNEPIGGVYVLDVPDIEAALMWAERLPASRFGVVEVLPVAMDR